MSCEPSCGLSTIRLGGAEEAAVSRIASDGSTAVLLTAVGGPNSLDEVGPFLLDIRGGRPTSDELFDEFRERYRRIGGGSPPLGNFRAQGNGVGTPRRSTGGGPPGYAGARKFGPDIP